MPHYDQSENEQSTGENRSSENRGPASAANGSFGEVKGGVTEEKKPAVVKTFGEERKNGADEKIKEQSSWKMGAIALVLIALLIAIWLWKINRSCTEELAFNQLDKVETQIEKAIQVLEKEEKSLFAKEEDLQKVYVAQWVFVDKGNKNKKQEAAIMLVTDEDGLGEVGVGEVYGKLCGYKMIVVQE